MKNLAKANKLIEEIARKHKEITPLTPKDYPLFEKFFKKERHTYGNSWTYIAQCNFGIGPFKLGYKYYDGQNLSSFSIYPHMEVPNRLCIYWTRPMGSEILDIIADYSKYFLETQLTPTYVKKIFKDQFSYLQKKGFKDTSKFPWHKNYPSEDDSYPEIIIDVKATLENSPHRDTIRNALKRYRSLNKIVKVKKITTNLEQKKGWKVVNEFFYQDVFSLTENISTSDDFYNVIFASNYAPHELFLIYQDGFPRGVFDLNKLEGDFYANYMSLMLREKLKNLNEFSIIYTCNLLSKKRGKFLNMGGSETENLHKFKSKFAIASINEMCWAVYF